MRFQPGYANAPIVNNAPARRYHSSMCTNTISINLTLMHNPKEDDEVILIQIESHYEYDSKLNS